MANTTKSDEIVLEVNAETGEEIEREMTAAEKTERAKNHADFQIEWQSKVSAKESALAKLEALGLTAEEIAAL